MTDRATQSHPEVNKKCPKVCQRASKVSRIHHQIPKGTIVIGNAMGIHHDDRFWTKPHIFDPDRFYDKANRACKSSSYLIPFSVGKRYCLGQSLAEKEMFLFFVGLMKAFSFDKPKDEILPSPNMDTSRGGKMFLRMAPSFKVLLTNRAKMPKRVPFAKGFIQDLGGRIKETTRDTRAANLLFQTIKGYAKK